MAIGDGWLRLEMTVHGTVEVVPWVRSFGPDVAVVAHPPPAVDVQAASVASVASAAAVLSVSGIKPFDFRNSR